MDRSLTAQRVRLTTREGSSLAESAPVRYLDVAHPDWPVGLRGTDSLGAFLLTGLS